jgi:Uma2 family endonuclease
MIAFAAGKLMTEVLTPTEISPLILRMRPAIEMTDALFAEFCQINSDLRIELTAQGELVIMSPAFADTGNRNFNLAVQLGIWIERDGTGIGFDSSAGFTLPNGAKRSPDAAWIQLSRWNALSEVEKASFAPICPDFVVELKSATDRLRDLQVKMQEYIDNGALLGWLIDRQRRQAHIYRPEQSVEILDYPDTLSGESILPGFILRLDKIW